MTPDTAALRAQIRANEDAAAFYGGTPNRIILDPDTVRALCDATDEVERLRKAVWASEEIDRRAGMLAGVQAERDASRTAHAALVADLWVARQWLDVATDSLTDSGDGTYVAVSESLAQVRAMLDRHAGAGS